MAFEKLAVLGVGAIGSVIGGYLSRAGRDIALIDPWPAHVEAMRQHGLTVTAQDEEFTAKVTALHLADVAALRARFDAVFLAVKSYDSVWAAHFILPHLNSSGVVVSAQNGINEDLLGPIVGYSRLIGCVVTLGAGLYAPGHVTRTSAAGRPSFAVGELHGLVTPRAQEIAEILAPVGPTHATANLWGERWAKLIVNSMANTIAGITGLGSAELRTRPEVFPIALAVAAEGLRVARALGVQVEPIGGMPAQSYLDAAAGVGREAFQATWAEKGKALGSGRPSLLQDIAKGRRAEVDHLNGYIARRGRELGIPTPMNVAIVETTKRVESGELPQGIEALAPLTQHL